MFLVFKVFFDKKKIYMKVVSKRVNYKTRFLINWLFSFRGVYGTLLNNRLRL